MASLDAHTQTELNDITAKDSFFKNADLMEMTFSHLEIGESYRSLCNAALTCKDFVDAALDALWEEMGSLVPLLKLVPALQVKEEPYVCANVHILLYYIYDLNFCLYQFLSGDVSQADWERLQYYSRKVKYFIAAPPDTHDPEVHPSTYIRIAQLQSSSPLFPSLRRLYYELSDSRSISHIFLFLSPLLDSFELHDIRGFENTIVGPFLATLSSQILSRIVLHNGRMTTDNFKQSIVHFKQLRSLELSDAVLMTDFVSWEVLGTLPSLENLTLKAMDPASHPAHAPENSNTQSGSPKYFVALESLSVTGSFSLIQHLLGFIDSPWLKSINLYPVTTGSHVHFNHDHEPEELFTPSIAIVASKWSQSVNNLVISASEFGDSPVQNYALSKCLKLLTGLHELQTFQLKRWKMGNMEDDVKRLVMSWPKLKSLKLLPFNIKPFPLSTLRIIAESCPELRTLGIRLDTSTLPPFDTSTTKSLRHNLEVLKVGPSVTTQTSLDCQIHATRFLDLIFPYLKSIKIYREDVHWSGISDLLRLCQNARQVAEQ